MIQKIINSPVKQKKDNNKPKCVDFTNSPTLESYDPIDDVTWGEVVVCLLQHVKEFFSGEPLSETFLTTPPPSDTSSEMEVYEEIKCVEETFKNECGTSKVYSRSWGYKKYRRFYK